MKYLDYLHYLYAYIYIYIVDEIYHLASPASPVKYMYNPIKTIKTNTIGTLNMLGKTVCICMYVSVLATKIYTVLCIMYICVYITCLCILVHMNRIGQEGKGKNFAQLNI